MEEANRTNNFNTPYKYTALKVAGHDPLDDVHFRVEKTTKISDIKGFYSDTTKISKSSLTFYYQGEVLLDRDTPEKLGMSTEDVVEVYQEQSNEDISFAKKLVFAIFIVITTILAFLCQELINEKPNTNASKVHLPKPKGRWIG